MLQLELEQVNLKRLRNEEHLQHMDGTNRLIKPMDLDELMISDLHPDFEQALEKERTLLEYVRKSAHTTSIRNENLMRDRIFTVFRHSLKLHLTPGANATKAKQAQAIERLVQHYRKTYLKVQTEKNATYRKFVLDVRLECSTELTALSLTEQINNLELACNAVENIMDLRRFDIGFRNADMSVAQARKQLDVAYTVMMKVLGAALILKPTPENAEFAAKFNGLALMYKSAMKLRKSRYTIDQQPTNEVPVVVGLRNNTPVCENEENVVNNSFNMDVSS